MERDVQKVNANVLFLVETIFFIRLQTSTRIRNWLSAGIGGGLFGFFLFSVWPGHYTFPRRRNWHFCDISSNIALS